MAQAPKKPAKATSKSSSKTVKPKAKPSARKKSGSKTTAKPAIAPEIVDASEHFVERPLDDELREAIESQLASGQVAEIIPDDTTIEIEKPLRLAARKASADSKALATTDPVSLYLAEIRKYPLLSREQEQELAIRYRETGDSKAAEMMVTANLRFVVKVAAEYSKFGAKLIDLIQEGNVGLMHAVKEFNPYKGVRLITYAVWWIRGYIQEYLMRQYSMVRIGTTQSQRKLFYRLQKERDLLNSMGQEPDVKLLSSRLGVSEQDVVDMTRRLSGRDMSLNQPLDADSNASLLDFEASDETAVDERLGHQEEIQVLRENIAAIRDQLSVKELFILENRLLNDEPMTLQEIGDHYGVTREAIRQLEARLINRIRQQFAKAIGEADQGE